MTSVPILRMTLTECQESLEDHLDWIETTGGTIIVTDDAGNDLACMVPYERYENYLKLSKLT